MSTKRQTWPSIWSSSHIYIFYLCGYLTSPILNIPNQRKLVDSLEKKTFYNDVDVPWAGYTEAPICTHIPLCRRQRMLMLRLVPFLHRFLAHPTRTKIWKIQKQTTKSYQELDADGPSARSSQISCTSTFGPWASAGVRTLGRRPRIQN